MGGKKKEMDNGLDVGSVPAKTRVGAMDGGGGGDGGGLRRCELGWMGWQMMGGGQAWMGWGGWRRGEGKAAADGHLEAAIKAWTSTSGWR